MHFFRQGQQDIKWVVGQVNVRVNQPTRWSDFEFGQFTSTEGLAGNMKVTIIPGRPTLSVQDQISAETPKRVNVSFTRDLTIHDFGTFFRVIDNVTNDVLVERYGSNAQFSPTGRFVYYFGSAPNLKEGDEAKFEVYDILANSPAYVASREDDEDKGVRPNSVESVRWALNDAILSLGFRSGARINAVHTFN